MMVRMIKINDNDHNNNNHNDKHNSRCKLDSQFSSLWAKASAVGSEVSGGVEAAELVPFYEEGDGDETLLSLQ